MPGRKKWSNWMDDCCDSCNSKSYVINLHGIHDIGKRNLEPNQVSFTGSWFEERIDCELDYDIIQPGETEKARVKLPYPGPGYHTVIVRVMDDAAGMIWKKDKDFYVPRPEVISVVP